MSAPPESRGRSGQPRRALLIVNPNSSRGHTLLDAALTRLRAGGIAVHRVEPESREDVRRQILRRAGEADLVVVGGGDGSLNAAAGALRECGLPLGVLPLGTANDLARTLGIPADLEQAAELIAVGRTRAIDLGLANDCAFFNVASLGLSTELAGALTAQAKRQLGALSYATAALRSLARAEPFEAVIRMRGETVRVRTYQIAVGSGRYYGGGVAVRSDARIDDGRLDLYSLEVGSAWKLALMAPWFRKGAQGAWREVRAERCTAFEVATARPMPVNLDGEILTKTPTRFEVLPGAIQVFAPTR